MTAYNPIAAMQRLEAAGFNHGQSATLADEMRTATVELVTKDDLDAMANKLTLRIGALIAAMLAVAVTLSHLFH